MIREEGAMQVRGLAKSFQYAFRGVWFCIRSGRNMRIHLVFTAYVLALSPFYHFGTVQMLLVLVVIGMMLFAEAVNTAVEVLVDLERPCYDYLARIAKDVAAGAVLICAVFAAVVGIALYLQPAVLGRIVARFTSDWLLGGLFLLSLPVAVAFIFWWPQGPASLRVRPRNHFDGRRKN